MRQGPVARLVGRWFVLTASRWRQRPATGNGSVRRPSAGQLRGRVDADVKAQEGYPALDQRPNCMMMSDRGLALRTVSSSSQSVLKPMIHVPEIATNHLSAPCDIGPTKTVSQILDFMQPITCSTS